MFYWFLKRVVLGPVLRLIFRPYVIGAENVPAEGGAIFNHGPDVVIIPELCSGCDKCLPACPVNCIYPFPEWETAGSCHHSSG